MKKFISILLLSAIPLTSYSASIGTTTTGSITSIFSYDDHLDGAIFIQFDKSLNECPVGGYLNPSSKGFNSLKAVSLAAMMANKKVILQLYKDKIVSQRCEIDAVRIYNN